MKQQDTNTDFYNEGFILETDITTLMKMNSMDFLELLDDFGILETKYIGDTILIEPKDKLKEDYNV